MPNEITDASSPTREMSTSFKSGGPRGSGDQRVELFRNGSFVDAWLSDVVAGDCFATKKRPSQWLKCTSNPSISPGQIAMTGIEIMQAKPMPPKDALPAPVPAPAPLLLDDVDDVDFKDVP